MHRVKIGLLTFAFSIMSLTFAFPEEVSFQSSDGVKIAGTLNAVAESKGTVILVHMLNHDRKDWNDFAQYLNQNGWSTFAFDLRGHGESRGDEKKIDWKNFAKEDFKKMSQDLDGSVQFLKSNEGVKLQKLFIAGASIGANLALDYAADHPDISGVILLSPGVDYRGIKPKRATMRYSDRPVLFVVSSEDTYSMTSSDFLYQLAPTEKKEIIKLNGKGHGTDMLSGDGDLKTKILDFIAKS